MSAGFDLWTDLARPIRPEGVRELVNVLIGAAQVANDWKSKKTAPPFGFDRNWRVVVARWDNNAWQWPGGVSPWVYDSEPANPGRNRESDAAATDAKASASDTAPAAEERKTNVARRPPPTTEPKFVNAARRLGVDVTATDDDVRAGMRRTMAREGAHPDQGGDPAIAQEITAAKNLLIERIKKVCS